jgi:hypothetical protein
VTVFKTVCLLKLYFHKVVDAYGFIVETQSYAKTCRDRLCLLILNPDMLSLTYIDKRPAGGFTSKDLVKETGGRC